MTRSNLTGKTRIATAALLAAVLLLAACSGSNDSPMDSAPLDYGTEETIAVTDGGEDAEAELAKAQGVNASAAIGADLPVDLKVIRDGQVDIRVEPGTFGQISAQLRSIAADLGGYITAGETHLQEIDDVAYTVGWITLRVPEDRFDATLDRVDGLGERLSLSVSSQDVTEEYVDLEGRLSYWRSQEEFYTRLMDEASEIDDLVIIQTRMQDVLLNIEQIEGRLRYLDSRTNFSTLTVGLTEVPGSTPIEEPDDPGIIESAIEQAGTVLLATIGGLIVGAAFVLPIALLALVGFGLWRAIAAVRKPKGSTTQPSAPPAPEPESSDD